MIFIRRRFKKALVTAALLSIFSMCPTRGQTLYDLSRNIAIETVNQANKTYERYSMAQLNIRKKPTTKSKIVGTINYGEIVIVKKINDNWVALIKNGKKVGYLSKKYLSKDEPKHKLYWIPEYSGYKSFMDYQKITDESSPQWVLQQNEAYTGDYGIRMVDGRYCVAIGFAFKPKIGQYFDLELKNGTVIPCIISDEKKHEDTTDDMFTTDNGCYTEFVVDIDSLKSSSIISGDISSCYKKWDSPVKYIKIYNKNIND